MIRIVNTPTGDIEVDVTGRKAGRGIYLCPTLACWEAGLKSNRLDHALRTSLGKGSREQLMKYAEENLKGEASAPGEQTG